MPSSGAEQSTWSSDKVDLMRVRVIVINWNSLWYTSRCLVSLKQTTYPHDRHEVVVVDNGSIDGSLERLRAAHPWAEYIANDANLGFAEACNRGIRGLTDVDAVALVNNDAVVEPEWLDHLVRKLESEPSAGAVAALLILDPGFVRIEVETSTRSRLSGVHMDGLDVTNRCLVDGGVSVGDPDWPLDIHREITGAAVVWVPSPPDTSCIELRLEAQDPEAHLEIRARTHGGDWTVMSHRGSANVVVWPDSVRSELANGLGTAKTLAGEFYDIGFGRPVDEIVSVGTSVAGFSGGGVLLRAEALASAGLFDPRFFAYYEDSDLSWRIRRAGWSVVVAPEARIHHSFGASGGSAAPWFFFLNYRNWFLTVIRNGDRHEIQSALRQVREWVRPAVRGNILGRLRRLRRPSFRLAVGWLRVVVGILLEAPGVLRSRSAIGVGSSNRRPVGDTPTESVWSIVQPRPVVGPPRPRPGGPTLVAVDRELFTTGMVSGEELSAIDASPSAGVELVLVERDSRRGGWLWSSPFGIAHVVGVHARGGRDTPPRSIERLPSGMAYVGPCLRGDLGVDDASTDVSPPGAATIVRIHDDDPERTKLRSALAAAGLMAE